MSTPPQFWPIGTGLGMLAIPKSVPGCGVLFLSNCGFTEFSSAAIPVEKAAIATPLRTAKIPQSGATCLARGSASIANSAFTKNCDGQISIAAA